MANKSIRQDEIDNALLSIDRAVTRDRIEDININTVSSEIVINYIEEANKSQTYKKIIKRSSEKMTIETYEAAQPKLVRVAVNTILQKVNNFEIIKKGNIYYYKITLKTGDVIIQCI